MKFSKSLMIVALLVSTQAVVLFGAAPRATAAKRPAEMTRPVELGSTVEEIKLESSLSSANNLSRYMERLTKYMGMPIKDRKQQDFKEAERVLNAINSYMKKEKVRLFSVVEVLEEQDLSMDSEFNLSRDLFLIDQVAKQIDISWDMSNNRPTGQWTADVVKIMKSMSNNGATGQDMGNAQAIVEKAVTRKYSGQDDAQVKVDAYMDSLIKKVEA